MELSLIPWWRQQGNYQRWTFKHLEMKTCNLLNSKDQNGTNIIQVSLKLEFGHPIVEHKRSQTTIWLCMPISMKYAHTGLKKPSGLSATFHKWRSGLWCSVHPLQAPNTLSYDLRALPATTLAAFPSRLPKLAAATPSQACLCNNNIVHAMSKSWSLVCLVSMAMTIPSSHINGVICGSFVVAGNQTVVNSLLISGWKAFQCRCAIMLVICPRDSPFCAFNPLTTKHTPFHNVCWWFTRYENYCSRKVTKTPVPVGALKPHIDSSSPEFQICQWQHPKDQ